MLHPGVLDVDKVLVPVRFLFCNVTAGDNEKLSSCTRDLVSQRSQTHENVTGVGNDAENGLRPPGRFICEQFIVFMVRMRKFPGRENAPAA